MFYRAGPKTREITCVLGWNITSREQRRNLRWVYRSRRMCGYSRLESRGAVSALIEQWTTLNLGRYVEVVWDEAKKEAMYNV